MGPERPSGLVILWIENEKTFNLEQIVEDFTATDLAKGRSDR